jgi:mRNA interferase RelE/StbE
MKYKVEFSKSAAKEFKKLNKSLRGKVVEALSFISQNPYSEFLNIKKLKGADELFRIRIGDYRIVYNVQKKVLIIVVIKIGHRKDIYKKK